MKKFENWIWTTILSIPICFVVYWHLHDRQFARDDAAWYLDVSQEIYLVWKKSGLFSALHFTYFHRHWKPILHPLFMALFLGITGGDTLWAPKIYLICCYIVLYTFILLILLKLLPKKNAILLTLFSITIPWVMRNAVDTEYNSEISFLTAVAGTIYFWLCSSGFKKKWASVFFCIMFAISICIRPVEAFLFFAGPLLVLIIQSSSIISKFRHQACIFCINAFVYISICLISILLIHRNFSEREALIVASFFIISGSLQIYFGFFKNNNYLIISIFSTMVISLVWLIPGLDDLWDWIYGSSFGNMTVSSTRTVDTNWVFLSHVFEELGGKIFLFSIILLSLKAIIDQYKCNKSDFFLHAGLCAAFIIPIACGLSSLNSDYRYYEASFLLMLIFIFYALYDYAKGRNYEFVWNSILIAITMGQLIHIFYKMNSLDSGKVESLFGTSNDFGLVIREYEDPAEHSFGDIRTVIGGVDKIRLGILFLSTSSDSCFDKLVDPLTYQLLARQKGLHWVVDRPSYNEISDDYKKIEMLRNSYNYLLVGPIDGKPWVFSLNMTNVTNIILDAWKHHRLNKYNLKFVKMISSPETPCVKFILLKTPAAPFQADDLNFHF